ncbi:MAG TPA: DNA-formamidopyrimidine glycosylase family protein [Tichowtungia sp.]|nr:DNA-formamidopyrimidine glycosylase family protein [Tichowtungia sp.]
MPELPDVEAFRQTVENAALRSPVQHTTVQDNRILDDSLNPSGPGRRLKSKPFTAAHRHGKVLFQAGIRPDRKTHTLSKKESANVYRKMHHVLNTAIDRITTNKDFPGSWLLPQRGRDNSCPRCDRKIKSMNVSGRTTRYCPCCQT